MPRFDGTGPNGSGPATGRGMGSCVQGQGCQRGLGRRGRGNFCRFSGPTEVITPQERINALKASKTRIEAEIASLEKEQK